MKKIRAKQKRLQNILGGDESLKLEIELLAEDDEEVEGEIHVRSVISKQVGFVHS